MIFSFMHIQISLDNEESLILYWMTHVCDLICVPVTLDWYAVCTKVITVIIFFFSLLLIATIGCGDFELGH